VLKKRYEFSKPANPQWLILSTLKLNKCFELLCYIVLIIGGQTFVQVHWNIQTKRFLIYIYMRNRLYIYIYIYICSMSENVLRWRNILKVLMDLHVLSTPEYGKWLLEFHLSLYVCMYFSLAPGRSDGFYSYSVYKSSSRIHQCPMNVNIPAPKLWALQMGSETQNGDFLENKRFWLN
jgi:hypothetical protein